MKDYRLGGMGQEGETKGGCDYMTFGNRRKGTRDVSKQVTAVLTLKWAGRPGELVNGFDVAFLCPLHIARTSHIHWPDICGNNSALLDPFDMSCIMVLEALVSFHF